MVVRGASLATPREGAFRRNLSPLAKLPSYTIHFDIFPEIAAPMAFA
jgi:hypothetical protein